VFCLLHQRNTDFFDPLVGCGGWEGGWQDCKFTWEEQQQQQLKDGGPLFRQGRTERYEDTGLAPKGARNMMHAFVAKHGGWMVHVHEHNVSVLVIRWWCRVNACVMN
jgi:hypothetical protein